MSVREQLFNDIQRIPEATLVNFVAPIIKLYLNNEAANDTKTEADNFSARFPLYGCAKGKIWMADDFDAPLEEMEEYIR